MKNKILEKAGEMFLSFGFKSVTMDDIATEMGVSKKTLYAHYRTKTLLVKEVANFMLENISCGIDHIHEKQKNPIKELFEIKQFVITFLKGERSSPQYQLQKYYPEIYANLKKEQFCYMQNCVQENLNRGMDQGLFRKNIDVEFVSKIYFSGMIAIKDEETFSIEKYSRVELVEKFLEYHLRAICTKKGLEITEYQLKN